ncbi:MAG: PilZ domain-containing protein [Deltaproteobacteria bacterium]|nr:PilZ domain-containing protein [Deltaproteobacteria bacterium]
MHQYRPARVAASLPVEIYTAPFYPPLRMRMENISTGGMFIRTSLKFDVGEVLMCKTWLPNMAKPCVFISKVARSFLPGYDVWDSNSGLGLQFLHGNEAQLAKLKEFVRSREQNHNAAGSASATQTLRFWEATAENDANPVSVTTL